MVIIKTRLKKIPKTCKECVFSQTLEEEMKDKRVSGYKIRRCTLTGYTAPIKRTKNRRIYKISKPNSCPLIEVDDASIPLPDIKQKKEKANKDEPKDSSFENNNFDENNNLEDVKENKDVECKN